MPILLICQPEGKYDHNKTVERNAENRVPHVGVGMEKNMSVTRDNGHRDRLSETPQVSDTKLSIALSFPEIIAVAVCVLMSPVWFIRLIHHGHYIYGFFILAISLGGGFSLAWLMVKRKPFLWLFIFFIMGAILLTCLIINNILPEAERFM